MNRGRPKKKPNVDTAREIAEMVKEACERMQEPFDDRTDRDPDLPSMNEVAREMDVTIIKLKRLLITGGFYSSATSRDVQRLVKDGKGIQRSIFQCDITISPTPQELLSRFIMEPACLLIRC